MSKMKKALMVVLSVMLIAAASVTVYAAEKDKVYWGIDNQTLILSKADTGCSAKGEFDGSKPFDVNEGRPWNRVNAIISEVKVDGSAGMVQIEDCMDLFYGLSHLVKVDLSGLDTGKTTSMWCMFDGCSSLKTVDVSMLNTSNVTNMQGMFYQCKSLETLDLSSFDTRKVNNMFSMFAGCSSLKSVDLGSFDMSNVKNATDMFAECDKLSEIKTGAGWTKEGAPYVVSWKKADDGVWYCLDMKGNKLAGWQKLWWEN